jgi:DNA-binding response OmpR family regulator
MGFEQVRFAQRRSGRRSRSGSGRRALVIEDHTDVGGTFAECLRVYGLDVRVARDGAAGLRAAADLSPDMAFVDLGLPDMEGREVGERLRATHPDLLLVALTASCGVAEQDRCLAAGFDCYVVKPMRMEVLEELLALVEARRPAGRRA